MKIKPHLSSILIIICFIVTFLGNAQTIELILQSGHLGSISAVAVSPSGKYFATGGTDNTVKVWDIQSGAVVKNFMAHKAPVTQMAFSDDNFYLLCASADKQAYIWSVDYNPDNKIIDASVVFKKAAEEKYTVAYEPPKYYDNAHQQMDGGYLKNYTGIVGEPQAVAVSHSMTFVCASDNSGNYYYWDPTLSKPQAIQKNTSGFINQILILPGDKKVITLDQTSINIRKPTGEILLTKTLDSEGKKAVLLNDGKLISVLFSNGKIQVFNTAKLESVHTIENASATTICSAIAENAFYFSTSSTIKKFEAESKSLSEVSKTDYVSNILQYSGSGHLIVDNSKNELVVKSSLTDNDIYKIEPTIPFSNIKMSPDWRYIVNTNQEKKYLQITDILHGNTFLIYPETAFTTDGLSVSSKHIALTLENGTTNIYDCENGFFIKNSSAKEAESLLLVDDQNLSITTPLIDAVDEYAIEKMKKKSLFPASFSPNGKLMFVVDKGNNVVFYDWKKDKQFRMIISPLGTVLLSPTNHYFESGNGHNLLRFRSEGQIFSFEQFDLHFNRPDMVLAALEYPPAHLVEVYKKAYNLRLKRLGYTNSRTGNSFHVPKIDVLNKNQIPYEVQKEELLLSVKAWDTKYKLEKVFLKINGNLIKEIDLKTNSALEYTASVSVLLSVGSNKIELISKNEKGALSVASTITVEYNGYSKKPDLYILTIGSSKYINPSMNLGYAAKDAKDIANAFGTKTEFFQNIYTYTLLDEEVTLENIAKKAELIKKCHHNDFFYFFIAGHGVLDENLDLYLATYDMDFLKPSGRGLSYSKVEQILSDIPSRHKLLLLDACHSGEIDKNSVQKVVKSNVEYGDVVFRSSTSESIQSVDDMNYLDLMKTMFSEMNRSSGATVISSAGGTEFALEGKEWKNGVFTYCLLNGLFNRFADLDNNGVVYLSELSQYLSRKVPEITAGKQKPTSRAVNTMDDIRIW